MRTPAEFDALTTMVRKNEGVRNIVYKDTLGIPTIGVGFNLLRKDAQDRLDECHGGKVSELVRGAYLDDEAINWLLRRDLDESIADVRSLMFGFDDMPLEAQLVLVDLRFNIGPKSFRGFNGERGTLQAFRDKDWKRAASMLKRSLWAGQVGRRADRSVAMLERLAAKKSP